MQHTRRRAPAATRAGHARIALVALAPALLLGGCGAEHPLEDEGPLNLLIVLSDTTREDHLGLGGYARDTTPRLNALAARGALFENHYSHASRTGPSVASLFTGLHPRSHGAVNPLEFWDQKGVLDDSHTTLAEVLSAAGWATAAFVTNPNVGQRFGFAQGFDTYEFPASRTVEGVGRTALRWLNGRQEPWMLYLHLLEPHSPYEAPRPYDELYTDPSYTGPFDGRHEQLDAVVGGALTPDAADREQLVALYDQEVRVLDAVLGDVLAVLEKRGALDRTVIVFLSDHGEEFLEHGSLLHGYTLYEEQLRVPLVVVDPRRGSVRVAAATRMVDVLPTLLELLDVAPPAGLQGRSLVPLMDGEELPPLPLYAEASLHAVKIVRMKSVTDHGWKLIRNWLPEMKDELYFLDEDPGETRDLIEEEPEQAARLRQVMEDVERDLPEGYGQ